MTSFKGEKYVRSEPNENQYDNLLNLPVCNFVYINLPFDIDKRFCVYCAIVKQGTSHVISDWESG